MSGYYGIMSNLSGFFYSQQLDSVAELIGRSAAWLSGAGESLLGSAEYRLLAISGHW